MTDDTNSLNSEQSETPSSLKRNLSYLFTGFFAGAISKGYDVSSFVLAVGASAPLIGAANAERGDEVGEGLSATLMYSVGAGIFYLDKICEVTAPIIMRYLDGI